MKKIYILTLIILFSSCGTRKIEKSQVDTKETTKTEIKQDTKIDKTDSTSLKIESNSDEIEIIPINTDKPSTVKIGTKYYSLENAKLKLKKDTTISTYQNIKNVSEKASIQAKIDNKKDVSTDIKQVDRESDSSWIVTVLIVLAFVGYCLFRLNN